MFLHLDIGRRTSLFRFSLGCVGAAILAMVLAIPTARAGLGVFVDGTELDGSYLKDKGWSFENGVLSVGKFNSPEIVISGENLSGEVSICVMGNARICLHDLSLRTQESNSTPFRIAGGNEVVLFLSGENRLEAGPLCAGLQLEYGASAVVITNAPDEPSAHLVAIGGPEGAGIGGASLDNHVRKLVVSGGRIEAYGGVNAAGIGGGLDGTMNEFLLEGGTVVARGGENGDDVGGGPYGSVSTVTVTGGSLDVRTINDVPKRNYRRLRRVVLKTPDWRSGEPVFSDFSTCDFTYGMNSVFADETCAVHFWLPQGQYGIVANGTTFHVQDNHDDITNDLSNISFRTWCRSNGFEPDPAADAGGEAALVRYAFGRPFGPPPVPEIDASGKYPVLRIPEIRRADVTVRCVGSPNLSIPGSKWVEFVPDKYNPDIWVASGSLSPYPSSFFARFKVSTDLPPVVVLEIGDNVFSVELAKTEAAKQFQRLFPLTFTMEKYNVIECYTDLDCELPASPVRPGRIDVGEFYLGGSQRLYLSLRSTRWAGIMTPIGKVENIEGFVEAVGEGNVEMTFLNKVEGDP